MGEPESGRKPEEIASTDIRDRFTEVMNRVAFGGEQFIVTVHGRPTVALVSTKDLDRLRALDAEPAGLATDTNA